MRISLKVLGILWLGLFLIIGGLLFNAYRKLKPETFIALLTEQVQKNYPGAKLNVENVSYRFSLDFNLNLEKIHLRRSGRLLGSIGEVELKIPWWLLLVNQGNAHINIKNLDIYVDHEDEPSSGNTPPQIPSASKPASSKIKVELPSYLADAKFTLRAKNISIRDIGNARRYFTVSKLLVREFQTGKNSAFEINIPIEIKHGGTQYLSDLWLFGDITPKIQAWDLNYRGEFRTRETNDKFQIEDLVIGGKAVFEPSDLKVKSQLELQMDKDKVGTGELDVSQDALVLQINFIEFPLNYFNFLYDQIKNPYLVDLNAKSSGNIRFEKTMGNSQATFQGKVGFDGNFMLNQKDFITGKWQIGFNDSKWEVSFMSPKGEASFFRRSAVDLKKGIVRQYIEEIGFSGLDLSLTIGPVKPLAEFLNDVVTAHYQTSITYSNCLLGEQIIDGSFKYGTSPEQKYYQGELKDSKSSFAINYSQKANSQVESSFTNFKWNPSFQFLTPYFSAGAGVLDGKVQGKWQDNGWENGEWVSNIKITGATEVKGKIHDFITRTNSFFDSNALPFKNIALNLSGKNGILNLNSLLLEEPDSIKINGSLSTRQKAFLTKSFPKNKKAKPIKKEVLEAYWIQKEL